MRCIIPALILIVVSPWAADNALDAQELNKPPAGFTALLNGKDLTGWHGEKWTKPDTLAAMPEEKRAQKIAADTAEAIKHWRVEDGELVNDGHGPYLTTDRQLGDIELLIDYKTVPKADSGIYLRGSPQVQIWDRPELGSGGLFNNRGAPGKDPLVVADKPFGQWNRFRILQIGARTTVYLNGKLVVDNAIMDTYKALGEPLYRTGPIQLQTHGGEIRWRNIFVREIETEGANEILSKRAADGFDSIFNGRDFTGWTGATKNYEVVDGAIRCKPHKGGTLYTEEEYDDFVVRLEFKSPVGGNNGLAIRYPGKGDTAYGGMTELQILDPGYKGKIDPRQAHGSAYGMVAAATGYLRDAGQWNFQEVTVIGSTIKVELNGTVILDTDLAKVTEFMGGRPHRGKDRKKGHFGFAGHNDPVQFRNIRMKKLGGN